ncbi:alpha-galactosidase, partial [bacterium]|nr:alpha-galactosidase [bacterium]
MRTPPFISPVRSAGSVLVVFLALFIIAVPAGAGAIWLDSLDAAKAQADGSVSATNCVRCGQPVTLGGEARARAISVSGTTRWFISLPGTGGTFTAIAGFDDCTPTNTGAQAVFSIIAPGTSVWTSGALRPQDAPRRIEAALGGLPVIGIVIECRGRRATAVLADAKIDAPGARIVPASDAAVQGDMGILTPPERPEPRINAPRVFGVRPGAPVLFTVPVSGERPMKITAERLPAGLVLDPTTGRLSGSLTNAGRFVVKIIAENAAGKCHGDLAIVASNVIALTPPLGWNSWNCWARAVDDAKVRAAADAFVKAGLINYGWSYINIDDCWEAGRDSNGFITANEKFPDMKALCGYVHDKGLKIGLYSSPGPKTCAGFEGSYQHELQDAQQWAAWGFDYLKYDWCSYDRVAGSNGLERLRKPYRLMRAALDTVR